MIKTLVKHGNGWALVVDEPLLDVLDISPDTPLEIRTEGRSLIISRADDRRRRFEAALENVNRNYGRALKKLAE